MTYFSASQALGSKSYCVPKAYRESMPEARDLEWTDDFFEEEEGVVAVFDFDYVQMVDFTTKTSALGQLATVGCTAGYTGFVAGPIGAAVAIGAYCLTLAPCFLKSQVEWNAHAQHVAVTRDGIRFVQDQRKSCWGLEICDKGKHSKTVPFDKITDCDIVEPAGSACLCVRRVLLTVKVDTASSGGEGKRSELSIQGLHEAHKFKQLVWAMKRSINSGQQLAYHAPQALEMVDRKSTTTMTNSSGLPISTPGDGEKVEFLLRDIRDELRENNQLLKELKKDNTINNTQQQANLSTPPSNLEIV